MINLPHIVSEYRLSAPTVIRALPTREHQDVVQCIPVAESSLVVADAFGSVPELLEASHSVRRWDGGEVVNYGIYGIVANVLNQVCLPVVLTTTRKRGIQHGLDSYG